MSTEMSMRGVICNAKWDKNHLSCLPAFYCTACRSAFGCTSISKSINVRLHVYQRGAACRSTARRSTFGCTSINVRLHVDQRYRLHVDQRSAARRSTFGSKLISIQLQVDQCSAARRSAFVCKSSVIPTSIACG